jgi:hypothetical protein
MKTLMLGRSMAVALVLAACVAGCSGTPLPTTASAVPSTASLTTTEASVVAGATCATGDGVNDACSCEADTRKSCSGFYAADWQSYASACGYTTSSWKYGLIDCLGQHDVSVACQTSLDRREALNAQMMSACVTYCRGTTPKPGAEPCVDRLKAIYASLNGACRTALDAHEAAKALDTRSPF